MFLPLPLDVRSTPLGAAEADIILCTAPISLKHALLCKTELTFPFLLPRHNAMASPRKEESSNVWVSYSLPP